MKTLSLWQPWASLVWLVGHQDPEVARMGKRIETRGWPTKYRGPLAIHAAKKPFNTGFYLDRELYPFADALGLPDIFSFDTLPYGCIIAVCTLVDCVKITGRTSIDGKIVAAQLADGREVTGNELVFGDYTPGRFAWILEDVRPLPKPIPAKGHQSLWNWEPPEEVEADG